MLAVLLGSVVAVAAAGDGLKVFTRGRTRVGNGVTVGTLVSVGGTVGVSVTNSWPGTGPGGASNNPMLPALKSSALRVAGGGSRENGHAR
jgi:hypothetical protein